LFPFSEPQLLFSYLIPPSGIIVDFFFGKLSNADRFTPPFCDAGDRALPHNSPTIVPVSPVYCFPLRVRTRSLRTEERLNLVYVVSPPLRYLTSAFFFCLDPLALVSEIEKLLLFFSF